jgi:hypothetical protein
MSTDTIEVKRGRGRPPVYTGEVATKIAELVRKHNASHALRILRARFGTKKLSMPTVLKIAKAHGVELKLGRPTVKAA